MRRRQRDVSFEVCRGRLVRHVRLPGDRGYTQFCTRETLEEVAHVVEQRRETGVTTTSYGTLFRTCRARRFPSPWSS